MKAFLLSLVAIAVLALGAGYVLPTYFGRSADTAFATTGARVSQSGSPAERGWQ
ncbi:MAG TPA: hypothetical protein VEB64_13780 [Azospirillaceae bacterium]|nr:hypothetical protein [Azospirillaceae bacterium]